MKRVAISTLGCKTNQFESAAMIEQLKSADYEIVPFDCEADIYIINSCTVTARTDAETRRHIRRAKRLNPASRVIATGCYAQVAPGDLEKMPELDSVFGNSEKLDINRMLGTTGTNVTDISALKQAESLKLTTFAEHTRAFLQIQNGCNSFCSYCIVPYARGRSRSVAPVEILDGIRSFVQSGYKEIVLTGIHLGAYGADLSPANSLTWLLKTITAENAAVRYRIGSIEPNELTDELLQLLATSTQICHHLHLPLQSGCDTILKQMKRHYSSDFFSNLIKKIVAKVPDIFIGIDVIAGFPGESDKDHADTVALISKLPISDLHVFPYSKRHGTKAAIMPGHLPSHIITERAAQLRSIAVAKRDNFNKRFIGTEQLVLIQKHDTSSGLCKGLTRNYIEVEVKGDANLVNREIAVQITELTGKRCFGVAVQTND